MDRMILQDLVVKFLKIYGYSPKNTTIDNAMVFSRPTGMGVNDEWLVYFHSKGAESELEERLETLLLRYGKIPGGPGGRRFFLSDESLGIAPEAVKSNGFTYQVPVWFFDREFSTEKSSPLKRLQADVPQYETERIAQPYRTENKQGKELLRHLIDEIENPKEACLHIVIAPAGFGKTVLMAMLYTELNHRFLDNKNKQKLGKRPLIMLPGHIKSADDIDGLINNFIGDEYDYGVASREVLKFWVRNNLTVLLLDGIEELLRKNPIESIYALLDEYVMAPGSNLPQVVIAIRKPLLSVVPELKSLIGEWHEGIKVYELYPWDNEQKQAYFKKNLKISVGEYDNFMTDIKRNTPLSKLCSVPFYCKIVADLRNKNEIQIVQDDTELIEYAFDRLCNREFEKGLDAEIFPVDIQKELFAEIAREVFHGARITKTLLSEYGEFYLALKGIEDETLKSYQIGCLHRHALLTQSGEDLEFLHDIMKQYAQAIGLLNALQSGNLQFFDGDEIEIDSFLMNYLIKHHVREAWKEIFGRIFMLPSAPNESATGFRNIIKILLLSDIDNKRELIRDHLACKNLAGLLFSKIDLAGFQLNGSNLDTVRFCGCNMQNVNLNGCHIKNTYFSADCNLLGTTIKGALRESIADDKKTYFDQKEIDKFFFETTKVTPEHKEPCQAVINIIKILDRPVRKGKGIVIPKNHITRIRCSGGVPADRCIKTLLKIGILSENADFVRIRLDLYDSVKVFIRNPSSQLLFKEMKDCLDEICPDIKLGCKHVYSD